jgi:hypothetical protein
MIPEVRLVLRVPLRRHERMHAAQPRRSGPKILESWMSSTKSCSVAITSKGRPEERAWRDVRLGQVL